MTDIRVGKHTILLGDVRERLRDLPDDSVHCCITSPPYFGLRDYGVSGQIGLEPTLAEYIATMVDVFREVRRVLRPDGTCWLNIGDSYARNPAKGFSGTFNGRNGKFDEYAGGSLCDGLKEKDLMMVPARLAIALVDDGWWLRSDIIWHKKAPMPESVTDRPTSAHEHIFLLAKNARYYYDADAVREEPTREWWAEARGPKYMTPQDGRNDGGKPEGDGNPAGRNSRNVWTLGPEPFPLAHFATFPSEIPRRAIKAGTSERGVCASCGAPWVRQVERAKPPSVPDSEIDRFGTGKAGVHRKVGGQYQKWLDENPPQTTGWAPSCACEADAIPATVLDPFLGSGTTMLVADQLGRTCIGVELNPEYARMAEKRVRSDAPLLLGVA